MNKQIFIDNYELVNKIGSGSFGEVYIARNKLDKQIYAAKIEESKEKNRLKSEYNIYKKINNDNKINGIPKVYNYIETTEYNILVMELLGKSLENIFDDSSREFTIPTILKLGEILQLRKIHIILIYNYNFILFNNYIYQ